MRKFILLFLCSFSFICASAQERKVEVTSERQTDNSVEIRFRKSDPGYFTYAFKFSQLQNTSAPQNVVSVDGESGTILSLRPTNKDQSIGYGYQVSYIRGKLKPKVDSEFAYMLPYPSGTKTRVVEAGFAYQKYFGAEKPADWKSYFFYTKEEETVTASRKGIVVSITDQYENEQKVEFTTRKNNLLVEHEDGTLVLYQGFKKGSFKVKVGDLVIPGMELGQNASITKNGYGISMYIYYLSSVDFESLRGNSLDKPKSLYRIVSPKFAISEKEGIVLENQKDYLSFSNEGLITKELSKREKKKYMAK